MTSEQKLEGEGVSPADFSITFQAEEKAQKPWGKSLLCFKKNGREAYGVKGVRRREATRSGSGSRCEDLGVFPPRKVGSQRRGLSREVTWSDRPALMGGCNGRRVTGVGGTLGDEVGGLPWKGRLSWGLRSRGWTPTLPPILSPIPSTRRQPHVV